MPATDAPDEAATQDGAGDVDLERLADKVYQLMLADLRLGLARGERPPPRSFGRPT